MSKIVIRFDKNGDMVLEDAIVSSPQDENEAPQNNADQSFVASKYQVQAMIDDAIDKLGTIVNSVQGKIGEVKLKIEDLPFLVETFIQLSEKGNTVATLDENKKVPLEQIPREALTSVAFCTSIEDRNELTPVAGDMAIVTEGEYVITYVYTDDGTWYVVNEFGKPKVTSVNGRHDDVILTKADVQLDKVENLPLATEEQGKEYLEPTNDAYSTPLRTKMMLDSMGIKVEPDGSVIIDGGNIPEVGA